MISWLRHSSLHRLFLILLLAGVLVVPAVQAQINGTRASVTSLGGSLIFPPGPRASVTSLGPNGYSPNFGFPNCCFSFRPKNPHNGGYGDGHRGNGSYGYGVLPLYSMPYYYGGYGEVVDPVDDTMQQAYGSVGGRQAAQSNTQQQQYSDDRLSRLEQQIDEIENTSNSNKEQATDTEPQKLAADQPETVLVFRDGHSVDVKNYAIVGDTLYDFSSGTRKKIALADLDLTATEKQNDARGLDFRLPNRKSGN